MKVVSRGEEAPSALVLDMVADSIGRFRLMEESEARGPRSPGAQESARARPRGPASDGRPSKHDRWTARVNALNEFSIPNPNSAEVFTGHIEFLEAVRKYVATSRD